MAKKVIWILVLIMTAQLSFGQETMDDLFTKFSKHKDVTRIKIGGAIMGFANLFTETVGVKHVEVLAFEGKVTEELKKAIKNLKDPSFETMVSTNEGNSRTKVMVKMEKDWVRELVVLTTEDGGALVRIKGKIKSSDIEKVIKEHGNG